MKVAGYIRVSTQEQAEQGLSLEAQEKMIHDHCKAQGWEVEIFIDKGKSGANMSAKVRENLWKSVDYACNNKSFVLAYSISRIARSLSGLLTVADKLNKCNAGMVSLTESYIDTTTAAGKAMFGMIGVFAQLEHDLASERTSAVAKYVKSQGQQFGRVPYGYKRVSEEDSHLVEDEHEQKIVAMIKEYSDKGCSLREISKELTMHGYTTRNGKPFSPESIKKILQRVK